MKLSELISQLLEAQKQALGDGEVVLVGPYGAETTDLVIDMNQSNEEIFVLRTDLMTG